MDYINDFWFRNFIEEKSEYYRKNLLLNASPNLYNWNSFKKYFSKIISFQFNANFKNEEKQILNFGDGMDNPLPYHAVEQKNKKHILFQISEPSDENIIENSEYLPTYMEILKISFYEIFSIIKKHKLRGDIIDSKNELNKYFVLEMLLPNYEIAQAYFMFLEITYTGKYETNIYEIAKYFHVDTNMITMKLKTLRNRGYF